MMININTVIYGASALLVLCAAVLMVDVVWMTSGRGRDSFLPQWLQRILKWSPR